ncbi:hypothetical protein BB560_004358 [Smittium megazygosporum]|uniref:DNA mismatch repair proteins mutS family domain-containing protein n=1 Tax=Smittium megazygosporum TaxID=133381 RepID=A0A2T9Z9L2_9FUNG|nr:hypothetical protein BB560_004358 [Smittium megazygosporum]
MKCDISCKTTDKPSFKKSKTNASSISGSSKSTTNISNQNIDMNPRDTHSTAISSSNKINKIISKTRFLSFGEGFTETRTGVKRNDDKSVEFGTLDSLILGLKAARSRDSIKEGFGFQNTSFFTNDSANDGSDVTPGASYKESIFTNLNSTNQSVNSEPIDLTTDSSSDSEIKSHYNDMYTQDIGSVQSFVKHRADESLDSVESANIVMVLAEGTGASSEIGFAVLNFQTFECYFSQFADSGGFSKTLYNIELYQVDKIIIPANTVQNKNAKLYNRVKSRFPKISFESVHRKFFNEEKGLEAVRKWVRLEDQEIVMIIIQSKFFCISALGALYEYLECVGKARNKISSVKATFKSHNKTMDIDPSSCRELELIESKGIAANNFNLFSAINHTKTKMGSRILRLNILQPSTDLRTINSRLDAVENLLKNESRFFGLQAELKNLPDIDTIVNNIVHVFETVTIKQAESNINTIIDIYQMLLCCQKITALLLNPECETLNTIYGVLNNPKIEATVGLLKEKIRDDLSISKSPLSMRNLRCYLIKEGQNGFLDVARKTFEESTQDALNLVKTYCDQYSVSIQIQYKHPHGYHLSAEKQALNQIEIPEIFLNVRTQKKVCYFTTLDLVKMNDRIRNSITEINMLSDKIIYDTLSYLGREVEIFYQLSEAIGLLDMLMSFATMCTIGNFVRPNFTNIIDVVDGRHPILDRFGQTIISNSFRVEYNKPTCVVIGENSGGKSVFIKQIALLVILAQIGSFVPAKSASFCIRESLFTHLNHNDDIETNASSFMMEMRTVSCIMRRANKNSLVVLDEIGRGTSMLDGASISYAIINKLSSINCFTLFTTHFIQICRNLINKDVIFVVCIGNKVDGFT